MRARSIVAGLPCLLVAETAFATRPPGELWVVPFGKPPPALIELVARAIRERFVFPVRVISRVPLPKSAWYAPRRRWRAERLLDHLERLAPTGVFRVLGVTTEPISTTKGRIYDWGIAGLGLLGGRPAVVTSRLYRRVAKDRKRFARYFVNDVLHEVGHTLGLAHCPNERCIMADAKGNALRAARLSSGELCVRCAKALGAYLRPGRAAARRFPTENQVSLVSPGALHAVGFEGWIDADDPQVLHERLRG